MRRLYPFLIASLLVAASLLSAARASAWVSDLGGVNSAGGGVVTDTSRNVFGLGRAEDAGGFDEVRVVKLAAADGNVIWNRSFSFGVGNDSANGLAIDSAGEIFVTYSFAGEVALSKLRNSNGDERWQQTWSPDTITDALLVDGSDDALVGLRQGDVFTVAKVSGATGAVLWTYAAFDGHPGTLGVDAANNVYAAGLLDPPTGPTRGVVVKLAAATGAELWRREFSFASSGSLFNLAVHTSGDVFVSGSEDLLARLDAAAGTSVFETQEEVNRLAVDASGDLLLATEGPSWRDVVVAKLDPMTAADLWRNTVLSLVSSPSDKRPLAIDGQGDVVVSGLLKVAGTTGAVLWTAGFALEWIAIDSNDEVIGAEEELIFTKLSGATGQVFLPEFELSPNPPSYDFQRVEVGESIPLFATAENTGEGTLTITAIGFSGGAGDLSVLSPALPAVLAPDEAISIEVLFAPSSAGALSTDLEITSNTTPAVTTIALTATAVVPECGDGADNDADLATDFPDDPECATARSLVEDPAVYDVDDTGDAPDASPGDASCATASATCTLRAAVMESNASAGPARIVLPQGTYGLALAGADENAAATGDLDLLDDVDIVGTGDRTGVVIDAAGLDRAFHVIGDVRAQLVNLSIANGDVETTTVPEGGAIRSEGSLLLKQVVIVDARADSGGAISSLGPLRVSDSEFGGNLALDSQGADAIDALDRAEVARTTFSKPELTGGRCQVRLDGFGRSRIEASDIGDAPFTAGVCVNGVAEITRSTIHTNRDGGILNTGRLTLRDSTLRQNGGNGFDTGGIDNIASAWLHAVNTTITDHWADRAPGGIRNGANATVILEHSTITDNISFSGNGGGAWNAEAGSFTVRNSIIAGNFNEFPAGSLNPDDCDQFGTGDFTSGGYNVVGAALCGGFTEPTDQAGTQGSPLASGLDVLADNGGPTQTHAVLAGSPALDSIPALDCTHDDDGDPATAPVALAFDQRGATRPDGSGCEAGAFELGAAPGECADGHDNDGDGLVDFPADLGCRDASWIEAPGCEDDLDNDGDGGIDWDGGPGGGPADTFCVDPTRANEKKTGCGLGFELVLLALLLPRRARRRR